jgi:hemerythrin-like domain-containing protein
MYGGRSDRVVNFRREDAIVNIINSLMQEHQVIGRTIRIFEAEIEKIKEGHRVNPVAMDISIDFVRIYTDQVHQGKEENILFRELGKKDLSPEHAKMIEELNEEHKYSRSIVSRWLGANERYFQGEDTSGEIIDRLAELTLFYPQHIEKENEYFFNIFSKYLPQEEQDKLIKEFGEFDKNILHWKYRKVETVLKERLSIDDSQESAPTAARGLGVPHPG